MSLKRSEFEVLSTLATHGEHVSQRKLSEATGLSLGTINNAVSSCAKDGLLDGDRLTEAGIAALKPYRVDNAIIMAAGLSSRFAPISYEKPKGLLRVRGEVLIERQIEQLLARGISDITVVVGYKREYFFYLRTKYGVKITVNPDYETRNNNSTLWRVRDRLANTYICSSDIYYGENPFRPYVYKAYYASEHVDGPTEEWCMTTGANRRITSVTIGGRDADIMLGEAYFDRAFSKKFVSILEDEYELPQTASKLWESIYLDHIKDLDMEIKVYPKGTVHEFDSLDQLRDFDPDFLENVDSEIFDNIVSVLHCSRNEIHGFYPLKQGLTNLSCHFATNEGEYVYRHPGIGTEKMINRRAEKEALETAKKMGIDDTFIYEDADKGWKISRFIPNARSLDPDNDDELREAMRMGYRLHHSGVKLDRRFDFWDEGQKYEDLLASHGPIDVPGYFEFKDKVRRVKEHADLDGYPVCISHNDFFMLNFLVGQDGSINLIDWEYAGMSDEANDYGTFVVCSQLSHERADLALSYYLGHEPAPEERRHFLCYVVLAGWCWYVWSLEKESEGSSVGEWLYIYYSYAADYVDEVLALYEGEGE